MDERNQLIKAMSDMGMDTKTFTDAVPTEAIKAMADFTQRAIERLAVSPSPRERWIAGLLLLALFFWLYQTFGGEA